MATTHGSLWLTNENRSPFFSLLYFSHCTSLILLDFVIYLLLLLLVCLLIWNFLEDRMGQDLRRAGISRAKLLGRLLLVSWASHPCPACTGLRRVSFPVLSSCSLVSMDTLMWLFQNSGSQRVTPGPLPRPLQ